MRQAGMSVMGFDYSDALLDEASARPDCKDRLARADMRRPPFQEQQFSAITMFFTAFGYFDDASNAATLKSLSRLLRPGGRYMLDLPDREHIITGLVPHSERQINGWAVNETRHWDGVRVMKEVDLRGPEGSTNRIKNLCVCINSVRLNRWPRWLVYR